MNNFLNDTENVLIEKRISNLIEQQLPSFLLEEGPEFARFLKTYYKWSELHELTVNDVVQFEFRFFTENDENFLTENDEIVILESVRNDFSAFINGETIIGQQSGASATVDRDTYLNSDKIYVKNLTRIDFIPDEIIKGQTSRVEARVNSFFKNPMFASRSLLKNIDLNTSTTTYIDLFFKQFLTDFDFNLEADKAHIIKHIVDVYRSKGSNISFDFLFKTLYNEQNLIYYTPKEDIFKLSSGQWVSNKLLRIESDDPLIYFEGRTITGKKSLSTAIVDRVDRFALGNLVVTELFLINPQGNFVIGETIKTNTVDDVYGEGVVRGVMTDVDIVNPGTDYVVGDILTITGGGGIEATAKVSEIASGILTDFEILDGGDAYTLESELTVNNFGTRGSGFAGRITEIQDAYTFHFNNDYIFNHAATFLDAFAYGMSGDPSCNISCRLIDALGFLKLNAGPISSIKTLVIGTGYESEPSISVIENQVLNFSDDSGVKILNLNPDPDDFIFTTAITGFFDASERIYSEDGNKVGTFFGLVLDENNTSNPSRMRVKNLEYLGVYGLGANDLTLDNSNYLNPDNPTIYDLRIVTGGKFGNGYNNFQFRRGLQANDKNIDDANNYTDIEYTDEYTDMTADFQTLKFNIDTISKVNTDAIVTTTYKHGLETGLSVNISGADDDFYNGTHEIVVINNYSFKYTVDSLATTPVTGNLYYDEGMVIKFTTPYNHDPTDRFLLSAVDFESNEVIIGYNSGARATVNTGAAFSPNINKGSNAVVRGRSDENQSGAIADIEITNFGIGYSTSPSISATEIGAGNAVLTARIGAMADSPGKYFDENGFLSYNKKIFDGYYYQDYSYVLKNKIQFNEYEQVLKRLIHPAGTKMFGEYIIQADDLIFSFDNFITFEDGSPIFIEGENNNRFLAEKYFEPNHNVEFYRRKDIATYGSGTLVRIQGGNNIISTSNSIQKLSVDFDANSSVIIDDEQKFLITYGEFKLENYYKGKISSDTQNVLSRIILSNPVSYTKNNLFINEDYSNLLLEDGLSLLGLENYQYTEGLISNFRVNDTLNQRLSNGHIITTSVFKTETDSSNNRVILVHNSDSLNLDLSLNVYTNDTTSSLISFDSNLIISNTYAYKIPKIVNTSYNVRDIIIETELDHSLENDNRITILDSKPYNNIKIYDGTYNINVLDNKRFQISTTFLIRNDSVPDFYTANVFLTAGSDFQNDFKEGDFIIFNNNYLESEVRSIINSSCISLGTRITSDKTGSYNLITENYPPDNIILEEDDDGVINLTLDQRISDLTSYDNKNYESHLILEQTVRGYTTANGLNDGRTTLVGINSKFHLDLMVNDIIALTTKEDMTSKILQINDFNILILEDDFNLIIDNDGISRLIAEDSIENQELVLSRPLGNGTDEQEIILFSTRNLDLEETDDIMFLNVPYDGSNNYIRVNDSSARKDEGLLLLDDGVGSNNPAYNGSVSLLGKILFESNTPFYDVKLKTETKY